MPPKKPPTGKPLSASPSTTASPVMSQSKVTALIQKDVTGETSTEPSVKQMFQDIMKILKAIRMDQLKDHSIAGTSDENPKIKEEVLINNEYDVPKKVPTSCKEANKEERTFMVTLSGHVKDYEVRGRLTDSVLSTLTSSTYVSEWMNKRKGNGFHLMEKKKPWNVCFNMGMPLKYVPDRSQFELKSYKTTNEVWYRDYDDVQEEYIVFSVHKSVARMKSCRAQSRTLVQNYRLHKECGILCICAPKGESIKDALCNDGRFMPFLKEENWMLVEGTTIIDNNFPVDNLSDVVDYEIGVESKKKTAKYSGDLTEKQNDSDLGGRQLSTLQKPRPDLEEGQLSASKKQQPESDCEQGQLSTSKRQQQQVLHLYPKLEKEREKIVKCLSGKKDELEAYKRNFGKEMNNSLSCTLMRTLAKHMDSVGYIEWSNTSGSAQGAATCFVLCGRYILTCHHVIKMIVGEGIEAKDWGNRIKQSARVTFSYEEPHPIEKWFSLENWFEIADEALDFAVLKLEENGSKSNPPPGLLQLNFPPPANGPIFIIGHPQGGVKSMDVCLVVSIFERDKAFRDHLQKCQKIEHCPYVCGYRPEKCIHMYNPKSFEGDRSNPNVVTYNICFFEGSSGSPVFDKDGQLVALHAAGFAYKMGNKDCSIIECGYSIHSIILKIKSTFKSWHDAIIAPIIELSTYP